MAAFRERHALPAVLELLKPITWFPPMWAFACGVVSSGLPVAERWSFIVMGILLAGPLVCGTSQAVNDWFDRHVDAINEPHRPIPSGRLPGRTGFYIAVIWTGVSLLVAWWLGPWVLRRRDLRPGRGLDVLSTAVSPEAEWLVWQHRLRCLLRRPPVVHRCRRHGRRLSRLADHRHRYPIQFRCARHHDAQTISSRSTATGRWASTLSRSFLVWIAR